MFGIKSRRALIRALSYTISAFAIVLIFAVSGFVTAYKYRMGIEYSYQRALTELSEHVDAIDIALRKGYYASTPAQLVGLSSQIWAEAGAAHTDLAQMPLTDVDMGNTSKFIAQAGDYANSLGRQISNGQPVTDENRAQIKSLSEASEKLSTQINDILSDMQAGRMHLFKSERLLKKSNIQQVSADTSVEDGFNTIEKSLTGLPSMIYDGPFSDSVARKLPELTQGKADVGREQARQNAAAFLRTAPQNVRYTGEAAGNLPTYNFTSGTSSIYVAKAGGYVVRAINTRMPGSTRLDADACLARAADFLRAQGIGSMTQTYLLTSRNICTINFAYTKNGVVCYPDLIKVGVAQDTGEIISFDASGYIMNHKNRALPAKTVAQSSVVSRLNPVLKLQKVSLAVIPTDAGEAYCYELRCAGENNQNVIDYFNAETGVEQQVLILTETPGGRLPV